MARNTLRDLMGLSDQPAALRDTSLIMIDCQNTYREGVMRLEGVEAAMTEAARLLARARAAGIPILHIMHDAGEGSPYDVRAEIGQISEQVAPAAGEPVIVKNYPNSFVGTDLDARLREAPGRDLILAGFMTHMCVNSTARGAFNLGYRPTVVASATATRELPGAGGVPVAAQALQAASLAAIGDLFGVVVSKTGDIPDLCPTRLVSRAAPSRLSSRRADQPGTCLVRAIGPSPRVPRPHEVERSGELGRAGSPHAGRARRKWFRRSPASVPSAAMASQSGNKRCCRDGVPRGSSRRSRHVRLPGMPIETVSPARLSRATMARQILLDGEQLSAPEAVQQLCALQAQEPKPPYLALRRRLAVFAVGDLHDDTLHKRLVLRVTLLRGILHLVTAADYPVIRAPLLSTACPTRPARTRTLPRRTASCLTSTTWCSVTPTAPGFWPTRSRVRSPRATCGYGPPSCTME